MPHLGIARFRRNRERHGGDDLAVFKCRGEQALEEILRRNRPLVGLHGGAEREQCGRVIRGGIVVGDRAADRAAIPHGGIADQRRQIGERGDRLLRDIAGRHIVMRRGGLDGQRVAGGLDTDQLLDLAEVDQVGGPREALLHHRQQRLAAGEEFCLAALAEQTGGFVDRGGAMIGGLVHVRSSLKPRGSCATPGQGLRAFPDCSCRSHP